MNEPTILLHRHLSENETDCIKRNITVHVDLINAEQNVAYCTVQQRLSGFLRRTHSVPELIWRGEQALAPLNAQGLVPLLTIRHKSLFSAQVMDRPLPARSIMDWIPDLWRWLGSPFAREGFSPIPLVRDPFGWQQALRASTMK